MSNRSIEKSFRIAKTDLQMRPIFHHQKDAIKGHIALCFMALCIAKYIELRTHMSIHKVIKQLKAITDSCIQYKTTGETFTLKKQLNHEDIQLLKTLGVTY